jgi:hypothetical protein
MRLLPVLSLLVAIAVACSGKSKQDATSPDDGSGPVLAKKLHLSWGIRAQSGSADVFLQTTDETGRQVSHPLGKFAGQCERFAPAEAMRALTGVRCMDGATGVELHAVVRDANIIVLRLRVDDGVTPDPMAREELTRIKFPVGAAVDAV